MIELGKISITKEEIEQAALEPLSMFEHDCIVIAPDVDESQHDQAKSPHTTA